MSRIAKLLSYLYACTVNIPRKFITAKLSIRKVGFLLVLRPVVNVALYMRRIEYRF